MMMKLLLVLAASMALFEPGQAGVYDRAPILHEKRLPLCPVEEYKEHCQMPTYACRPTVDQVYFKLDFRYQSLKTHSTELTNGTKCQCLCGVRVGLGCDYPGLCAYPAKCSSEAKCVQPCFNVDLKMGQACREGDKYSIFDYDVDCVATKDVAVYDTLDKSESDSGKFLGEYPSQCFAMKYLNHRKDLDPAYFDFEL